MSIFGLIVSAWLALAVVAAFVAVFGDGFFWLIRWLFKSSVWLLLLAMCFCSYYYGH